MWKICGKAKSPQSLEGCTFPQYFHTRHLIEITVFYALNKSALAWKLLLKGIPAYSFFIERKNWIWKKEVELLKVLFVNCLKKFNCFYLFDLRSPLFTSWSVRLSDYEYIILVSVLIEIILRGLESTLSRLRQFLIIESVLMMMKNAFISF